MKSSEVSLFGAALLPVEEANLHDEEKEFLAVRNRLMTTRRNLKSTDKAPVDRSGEGLTNSGKTVLTK